jgi:hypothetical protein
VKAVHTFDNEANRNTWIEYLGPFQMDLTPAIINGTNPLNNGGGGGPLSTNANTSYTSHYGASSKMKHQKNQSVVVSNK